MTSDTTSSFPPSESRTGINPRLWQVGNVLLTLALIGQLFLFQGERLARDPGFRPLLEILCSRLDCRLPPFRDLDRIKVVERALYPIKVPEGGHEFYLAMINQAPSPQPYPRLALTLTALDGTPIGRRVFKPGEYLPSNRPELMPSQKTVFVRLRLAPLGRPVGGFQFEFLP